MKKCPGCKVTLVVASGHEPGCLHEGRDIDNIFVKNTEIVVGSRIVLPANWPDEGQARERVVVLVIENDEESPYSVGDVHCQTIDWGNFGPEDDSWREGVNPKAFDEWETWEPQNDEERSWLKGRQITALDLAVWKEGDLEGSAQQLKEELAKLKVNPEMQW